MARKACLHLEEWERKYLKKYGILPHNDFNSLLAQGIPFAEAVARSDRRIQTVLAEMEEERKDSIDREYLALMRENPFLA